MSNLLLPRKHGPKIRATARASNLPGQQFMGVLETAVFFGVTRETLVRNWPKAYGFPGRVDIKTGKKWTGPDHQTQAFKISDLRAWLMRWGFEK